MKVRYPDFYKKFRCTAEKCGDTCCGGWNISVDERSLRIYRKVKGPLGKKIRQSVDFRNGCFRLKDRKCPLLSKDGLCEIQCALGEETLCRTCRNYPRHMEDYGEIREYMLMLSCPEAARMILGRKEKDRYVERGTGEGGLLLNQLLLVRSTAEEFLQDRALSPELRTGMLLALAHDVQNRLDAGKEKEIEKLCRKFAEGKEKLARKISRDMEKERPESRFALRKAYLRMFEGLETVTDRWQPLFRESEQLLFGKSREAYEEKRPFFEEAWREYETAGEHFLMCFVFTYMAGAVYDRKLYTKAAFAALSYLCVKEMAFARWLQRGTVSFDDLVEIVHIYSRECEHSDNNLEALEQILEGQGLFSLERFLYVLENA